MSAVLLGIVLAWAMTAAATAQERARDFISPRINRTQFQQFLQKMGLGSDQRQIANIAFMDYDADLNDLAARLDERALAVGRQTVDDALAGKARLETAALQAMRADVYRVYLDAGPQADLALDMLLGGIEALLLDEQLLAFETARKWLFREIMLKPRAAGATFQEYAGDGVNVMDLVELAQADGGELAGVDREALNTILNRYEDELDAVLIATTAANRQGQLQRKIASIAGDVATLRAEEAAAVQRWRRLHELNARTVEQIAALARAQVGAAAEFTFKQRFDRAAFSWLYPRKLPDRQIEWIRNADVPPETLAKAEQAYANYVSRRDGLSRAAIDMMLRARMEFQAFLYAMMEPSSVDERLRGNLYSDLLKNSGEQSTLERAASSELEALLDDSTRSALRDAMRRPDRTARPPQSPQTPQR